MSQELIDDSASRTFDKCFHCELPLGRRFVNATVDDRDQRFCCYGCVLAQQVTRASGEPGAAASILIRLGLGVFCAMNVMAFSLPTYAPYVYGNDALSGDGPLFQIMRLLSAAFALPVILLLGGPILAAAGRGLRRGAFTADALIVVGAGAAYGLSLIQIIGGGGEVYFETAAMLLVIVTIGRYLEARAKADAGALVKAALAPSTATAVRLIGQHTETVACGLLIPGDVVRVLPGDAFPTDGIVLRGEGGADEAALTGESRPVHKGPGAAVAGGTCSIDGTLDVLVTARQSESAAARIAELLAEALRQRGNLARLADRAAQMMLPGVVAVALLTAAVWGVTAGPGRALMTSLAVLVVACPCALGIATPAAMWMGLLAAARRGVIVRSGAAIERAAGIDCVVFDKTGTLTGRRPEVTATTIAPGGRFTADEALAVAGMLEQNVRHPMARALVTAARGAPAFAGGVSDLRVLPGRGVTAIVGGHSLTLGSVPFASEALPAAAKPWLGSLEPSSVVLWGDHTPLAAFTFREALHPSAQAAISLLRQSGRSVGVLSGDQTVDAIVPELVDAGEACAGLSAAQKVDAVRARRRSASVAMVGDGLNDAPASAAADLGIAVSAATDLTRVSADVVVLDDDLRLVPWFLDLARRVRRIMYQNLSWAVAYNLVAVGLAVFGKLNPLIAAVAMVASSVLVVANARRLLRTSWNTGDSRFCESPTEILIDPSNETGFVPRQSVAVERHGT